MTLALLEEVTPDEFGLDDRIEMWSLLDVMIGTLAVYRTQWALSAAGEMPWTETYTHPTLGPFHRNAYPSTKWNGAGVLTALTRTMIDPDTGETVGAVPTEVLRDVLPAVGDGMTSSSWKASGLGVHGIDASKFKETTYGQPTIGKGPRR
jgi:hypothetical protein